MLLYLDERPDIVFTQNDKAFIGEILENNLSEYNGEEMVQQLVSVKGSEPVCDNKVQLKMSSEVIKKQAFHNDSGEKLKLILV